MKGQNEPLASLSASLLLIVALAAAAHAQWLNHPSPSLPRASDGKPDLNAPAPRTPNGNIDLSGIWLRVAAPRPPSAFPEPSNLADYLAAGSTIEMLPDTEAKYRTIVAAEGRGHPSERCLPKTFPNQALLPLPIQIAQTNGTTFMLFEEFNHFRQVLTDGRGHPADMNPTWFGYSVGRWEDDVFVVDARGFRDGLWLDGHGHTATDRLRTIERWIRVNVGQLRLQLTIDDPGGYKQPWTADIRFTLIPDTTLLEFVCENERFGSKRG